MPEPILIARLWVALLRVLLVKDLDGGNPGRDLAHQHSWDANAAGADFWRLAVVCLFDQEKRTAAFRF